MEEAGAGAQPNPAGGSTSGHSWQPSSSRRKSRRSKQSQSVWMNIMSQGENMHDEEDDAFFSRHEKQKHAVAGA